MTLVIMFSNAPMLVSDIMVSNSNPEFFHAHWLRVREKDNTILYSVWPSQKIIKIRDGICIAYAGSTGDANALRIFALSLDWPFFPDFTRISPLIERIREFILTKTTKLQSIIYADGLHCHVKGVELSTPVGPATVIGLGIEDFREYIKQHPTFKPGRLAFPGHECLLFALSFFAELLIKHTTGVGSLENRWGLGMEIIYQGVKWDRTLFQAFFWEKSDGREPQFTQIGAKILSYYQGDNLMTIWQWANGRLAMLRAAPLGDDPAPVRTLREAPPLPQLTVTMFVNPSDYSVRSNLRYDPAGDNICSVSRTSAGAARITHSPEEVLRRFAENSANLEARSTGHDP